MIAKVPLRTIFIVLLATLISVASRIISDTLHIPGYYDLIGIYFAIPILNSPWSLPVALIAPPLLSFYYSVYFYATWIYIIVALVFYLIHRRSLRMPYIGVIFTSFIYALLWFVFYGLASNKLCYLLQFLRMKEFIVLLQDSLISFLIAYTLYSLAKDKLLHIKLKYIIALIGITCVIISVGYVLTYINEWGVTGGFTDHDRLLRFHTKMDFVWLPLGEKGINNFYYPHGRFERGSPGYQVWIGMYWIQGYRDPKDLGLIAEFAVWDQNFWLGIHGCKEPYTYVDLVVNITEIEFKGYKAYLMYGGMISRSDVKPYEEVKLREFFITFYDPQRDRTAIICACSTEENYDKMISKLWEVVNSRNLG